MATFSNLTLTGGFQLTVPPPPTIPFVAVSLDGTNRVMTSLDGITWTARNAQSQQVWTQVAYSPTLNRFVAINNDQLPNPLIMYSDDGGGTWTGVNVGGTGLAQGISMWYGQTIKYVNNMFIAGSNNNTNRIMYSTDGITWTGVTYNQSSVKGVVYGNGVYNVLGTGFPSSTIYRSTNLSSFTVTATFAASGTGAVPSTEWGSSGAYDILFANGVFVAVGQAGFAFPRVNKGVAYSTDGITYTVANIDPEDSSQLKGVRYSLAYGNGTWVSVGSGKTAYSTDGINWTFTDSANNNTTYRAVTYKNNLFCAVGDGGAVMTSTNGINWTGRTAAANNNWRGIA